VGALFAVQVALIFLFSRQPPEPALAPAHPGRVLLAPTLASAAADAWMTDPAQFALASPDGFSGRVWRERTVLRVEPRLWTEPPRWLARDLNELGRLPAALPLAPAPPAVAEAVPVVPAAVSIPTGRLQTRSLVRVEGDLASRPLARPLELPSWETTDVLQPSTVQVLVRGDGSVVSATLLTRSGLPAADQRALDLARAARFAPLASPADAQRFQWGQFVFVWHALEPAPAPATPPPS